MRPSAGRPLRIVEIEVVGRGGLAHYTYNLSAALASRGHDVTLVTAASYELDGAPRPQGLHVVKPLARLGAGSPAAVTKIEAAVDACRTALFVRRLRPDVIHLQSTLPIALAHLLLRPGGVPMAVTAHVVTAHERGRLDDAVRRAIHRLSPLIIAHSEFDRKRLMAEFGVPPARTVVIPHGEYGFFARPGRLKPASTTAEAADRADARRSMGLPLDAEVALFFGFIREYKGLDILLDAWPEVARARPNARLVIAGDPARLGDRQRRAIEAAAARVGAVHRFGYVPFEEVPRYFAAADVVVLPYRHVSQSGALYLALALGLPVVATRVGAFDELLTDQETALLVPPGSPGALAIALARALGDPGLRAHLSAGGLRLAAQHSWPAVAERTESALARLVAGLPADDQRESN